jgi:hypothetical protein
MMPLGHSPRVWWTTGPVPVLATGSLEIPAPGTRTPPALRAFRDSQRQLQDARATTDAGLAEQLADWSRALLLHA